MTLFDAISGTFDAWIMSKIKEGTKKMAKTVADIQAQLAELETIVLEEKAQVAEAIDELTARVQELIEEAAENDLEVLSSDVDRVAEEVRAIFAAPEPEPAV